MVNTETRKAPRSQDEHGAPEEAKPSLAPPAGGKDRAERAKRRRAAALQKTRAAQANGPWPPGALDFARVRAYNGFFTDEGFLSQENCTRARQPLLGFGVFRA